MLQISCSVVGRNCKIGKEVVLRGCYIHDNVTIWDQAELTAALVFDHAVIMSGAILNPGCTISFKVGYPNAHCWSGHVLSVVGRLPVDGHISCEKACGRKQHCSRRCCCSRLSCQLQGRLYQHIHGNNTSTSKPQDICPKLGCYTQLAWRVRP